MTTEIHRIPGTFNLPADWPRVPLGNIASGLWAEYVGDDLKPADAGATFPTTGTTMMFPWTSRTGNMSITAPDGIRPNVAQMADRFNGHRYMSVTGSMGAVTESVNTPHAGPLTVTGYVYLGRNNVANTLFSTGTTSSGYYAIQNNADSTQMSIAATATSGATPAMLTLPTAQDTYFPIVACFNGADSYFRIGDSTVAGTLPETTTSLLRLANNAARTAGYFGRVAHLRVYRRALTADEAYLSTSEFRSLYA